MSEADRNTISFEVPVHPLGFTDRCAQIAFERDEWRYVGLRTEGNNPGEYTSFAMFERDADGPRGLFTYRWVDNQRDITCAFLGGDNRFNKDRLPTSADIHAEIVTPILSKSYDTNSCFCPAIEILAWSVLVVMILLMISLLL